MDDQNRIAGSVRDRALSYAVQTAEIGEDVTKILARAELYVEFMSAAADRCDMVQQRCQLLIRELKAVGDCFQRDRLPKVRGYYAE